MVVGAPTSRRHIICFIGPEKLLRGAVNFFLFFFLLLLLLLSSAAASSLLFLVTQKPQFFYLLSYLSLSELSDTQFEQGAFGVLINATCIARLHWFTPSRMNE